MKGGALLGRISAVLTAADVPFMLTGSVAAAYHGAPRATLDIDVVIDATPAKLRRIVAGFLGEGLYASEEAALQTFQQGGMFNVIDSASGWKVDLIHIKSRPFSRDEFARRIETALDGVPIAVATLEDVILSKLEWAKLRGSLRQLEDVAMLIAVRAAELDRRYVDRWVDALDLRAQWEGATKLVRPTAGA